ncbi:O-succinylbenzoic acid--CoA ligase [Ancylomarina euxinus]|uniref:O-succinylbenzoic acid--CoA ligase n=1 Tax=Ancylomarina euxinus TaxID=2283627 RepID=A0A425XZ85_9BACT|nr:AMP-binding protein [Ancylomarina euxinus]MCZ4695556.1 AMP-binding protein [Ancylomarina euxinus]MUP15937.1 AMP-binding protein [Ancylomarina euxinus]RRG20378.1 O-succinylbenzoic acid--CoA ligase [Ancylomarina euxinus]
MKSLELNFSQLNTRQLIALCQDEIKTSSEQWQKDIYAFTLEWLDENLHVKAKTSGSTGKPKTIQLEKAKMIQSAKMTGKFFSLKKGNKALLCLSPQFIAGKMMIVRAHIWQMNLICVKPDGHPLTDLNMNIDFAAMIPLQVANSIHNNEQINRVKTILIGGGVVDKQINDQLQDLNCHFYSSFGMTETLSHIALKSLNGADKSNHYKALGGIKLSIDDRDCLKITAPKLLNQSITTNDIVNLVSNKEFEWLGRFDHVINSGGIKLFPEQIEEQLVSFISYPFFLIGIPDDHLGEKMILLIESNHINEEQKKQIHAKIDSYLEKFQRPRAIYIVPKFKRTLTNKIQRKATLISLREDGVF